MLSELKPDQRCLADYMSEISEICYSAGWMHNLEYVLWDAVINGERDYGRQLLSLKIIEQLKLLSDVCGCWIIFDDEKEELAVPLEKWEEHYSLRIIENPNVVKG